MAERPRRRIERALHWTAAPGLVLAVGLASYGAGLPYAAGREAAWTVTIFALHKTLGVLLLVLGIGLAASFRPWRRPVRPRGRVAWAPVLDRVTFWGLLTGALVMPLSGPILHAMGPGWGYAPIWWPFGDRVPMVPERLAASAGLREFHLQSLWLFAALVLAHVALAVRVWLIRRQARPRRILRLRLPVAAWRLAPATGIGLWAGLSALVWVRG